MVRLKSDPVRALPFHGTETVEEKNLDTWRVRAHLAKLSFSRISCSQLSLSLSLSLSLPLSPSCPKRPCQAKARRRSAARGCGGAAGPATSSVVRFWPSDGGVGDSGGGGDGDGRWRKLHARGGGGAEGPPKLKLSVEAAAAVAAGDHDDVLLSPSCHRHQEGVPPAHSYCSSPVSLSLSLGLESGGGGGGRGRGRARDNVLVSSMDSVWSMGSIDEADAREVRNGRKLPRFFLRLCVWVWVWVWVWVGGWVGGCAFVWV